MKYLFVLVTFTFTLASVVSKPIFAQEPPPSAAGQVPPNAIPATPLKPGQTPSSAAPDTKLLPGQVPIEEDYWAIFNQRMETEYKRYAEEHPEWPKGEPAPRHIAKKALAGLTGKNLLDAVRMGVNQTRETYKDAPAEERDLQIELAIERVLEFFPLVEINPQGYMNLFYIITAVNSDPVYRSYLIKRTYPSVLPDTLFSLYLQDKCKESSQDLLSRLKNIFISPSEHADVQLASIDAFKNLVLNDVLDTLKEDREIQRIVSEDKIEISPSLLREEAGQRISDETRDRMTTTLSVLDVQLLALQEQFSETSTRPDWLKKAMLNFIEDSLKTYTLPSAQKHIDFLAAQGRDVGAFSAQ